MASSNLKSLYRGILRNQGIVFINVFGFAVAMTCCILIFLYMADEHAYDRHNVNHNRIYRVCLDRIYPERNVMWAPIPPAVRDGIKTEFPEVAEATRIRQGEFTVSTDRMKGFDEKVAEVDESFFRIFTHKFIYGDPATALQSGASLVITRSMAEKYFESIDVVGKSINIGNAGLFNISGVIEDVPETSHIRYNFIIGFGWDKMTDFNVWNNNFGYYTYIFLNEGASWKALEEKLPSMSKKYLSAAESTYDKWRAEGNDYRFFLQPLLDIHLHSNLRWEAEVNGNATYVLIFMGVGLLVLVMAIINFVNLSTARYSVRAKEVSIRKVLGSLRRQLVFRFMAESVVLSSIAILISLLLTEASLPWLNVVLEKNLALHYLSNPLVIPSLIVTALFVGILSGIYPALQLSSFRPATVLRSTVVSATGLPGGRQGSGFRNRLVVFQFVISFFLITGTWIVFSQLKYIQSKDLGMTTDNILVIAGANNIPSKDAFKNQLMEQNNVISVAASADVPGKMEGASTFRPKGFGTEQELNMTILGVDTGVLKTWGLKLVAGRDFVVSDFADTNRYVILNETAVKQFGWPDDPIGKELLNGGGRVLHVTGVVKDFHMETLRREIRPLLIMPNNNWLNVVSVRLSGDPTAVVAAAEKLWKEMVPERPFTYYFMDEHYNSLYKAEQTTGKLFMILTVLAIIIASLGLLGLSAFMAERRTKEIGIRKAIGASTWGIVWLLIEDLSRLVLIAILIGIPLASLAMTSWLNNFAYRMSISYVPFLVSGIISFLMMFLTVLYHAMRAARTNPVNSLRQQ
ncbi:MAG TPA: ABC transporter permease [Cyclobacteriaceae bacterium]|nr:ABC transporter permease [Cyclobacteriaceae bacterium]